MRINLVTPFAEKDAVKALGARWDAALKVWYIKDVADLTPFSRWINDSEGVAERLVSGSTRFPARPMKPHPQQSREVITPTVIEVPHCGCDVPPWEDCVHSAVVKSR
jgi:hypothetical protein